MVTFSRFFSKTVTHAFSVEKEALFIFVVCHTKRSHIKLGVRLGDAFPGLVGVPPLEPGGAQEVDASKRSGHDLRLERLAQLARCKTKHRRTRRTSNALIHQKEETHTE